MNKISMKRFLFLFNAILVCAAAKAQIIYGVNNYTEYHPGNLPIVISVPHGGSLAPTTIPDRSCNNPTLVTDSKTIELALQIDSALFNMTNCHPHLIICNLKRTKVDCNRSMADGACGNAEAETAWTEFQHFIDTAQSVAQTQFLNRILYIDLHGHGKTPYRLELGYGLSGTTYDNSDSVLNSPTILASSSMGNLAATNFSGSTHAELIRGPFALGTLLVNAGFPSVPSQQTPTAGGFPYFSGGYNTDTHTCINQGNLVNGLQLECDSTVRFGYPNRKAFADSLASVLAAFLNHHQNLDLSSDCGLIASIPSNAPSHSNTLIIKPNPASDYLDVSIDGVTGEFEILVMNLLGQVVYTAQSHNRLDLSQLGDGVYHVILQDSTGLYKHCKLIKQ